MATGGISDVITIAKAFIEASGHRDGDFRRHLPAAKRILTRSAGDVGDALERIRETKRWAKSQGIPWSLYTVLKRWNKKNTEDEREKKIVRIDSSPKSIGDLLRDKNLR